MKVKLLRVLCALFIVCGLIYAGVSCAIDNEEDDDDKWTSGNILVQKDDIYTFRVDDSIGIVSFRKVKGPIGSRIDVICRINKLATFDERKINAMLYLVNDDAARGEFEPIEWVQEGNEKRFFFIIPLVETVPTLLTFRVLAYEDSSAVDDDTTDDDATDDDDDTTDDDTTDDDTTDDDTTDDDTTDDDDDSTTDGGNDFSLFEQTGDPAHAFSAWYDFVFAVSDGTPGLGD